MEYTEEQQIILNIKHGKHIVHAPAGCGKTEILTQRIIQALTSGQHPESMICLTFTNRAAIEMTERLQKSTNNNKQLPFVGNIHKYCNLFLRKNKLLPDSSTLIDEDEYKTILNGIIKKFDKKTAIIRTVLFKYLSDQKRIDLKLNPIHASYDASFESNKDLYYKIYQQYENVKKEFNFYDFDDLLNLANYHLKKNKGSNKQGLRLNSFDWIQIDEVQDLNEVQWEIIELISEKSSLEIYYGDYEQSIFSFLGSSYTTFLKRYEDIKNKHSLAKNYRSSQDIILILNKYLESTLQSKIVFDSDQIEIKNKENFVIEEIQGTVEDELHFITNRIKTNKYDGESVAVLVRTNKNAELCSNYFNEIGINHLKVSGIDFFQRNTLKDLFAILNGWSNPFDILAWTRIYKRFSKSVTLDESRKIIYSCYKNGVLPKDLLNNDSYLETFQKQLESKRCIVFDTETTGLDTLTDDIIQIAATEIINGKIGASFNCYIKTTKNIAETYDVHKISQEILDKQGVDPTVGLEEFLTFVGTDSTLIAHNLNYDKTILNANLKKYMDKSLADYSFNYLDSLIVSKLLFPKLPSYKLESLLHHFKLEGENSHNAIDDVFATVNLIKFLTDHNKEKLEQQRTFLAVNSKLFKSFRTNTRDVEDVINSYLSRNTFTIDLIQDLYKNLKGNRIIDEHKAKVFFEVIKNEELTLTNADAEERLNQLTPFITGLKEVDLINSKSEIVISTPHKAKGLGFDHVIIAECNTGVYPGYYSKTEEQILEDKRILYVAMSRAKKGIIITHHTKFQTAYGTEYSRERSHFIDAISDLFINT